VDVSSYPRVFLGLRDLMMVSVFVVVENVSCVWDEVGKGMSQMVSWITTSGATMFILDMT
jgi:hypothetical protein